MLINHPVSFIARRVKNFAFKRPAPPPPPTYMLLCVSNFGFKKMGSIFITERSKAHIRTIAFYPLCCNIITSNRMYLIALGRR
jgi:hypothetical protein